jgi:hypothetical protein
MPRRAYALRFVATQEGFNTTQSQVNAAPQAAAYRKLAEKRAKEYGLKISSPNS